MRGISKAFGHVQALDNVDFEVHAGELLALVGDNGAGKSTLVKILSGVYRADRGDIYVDGARVQIECPSDATKAGIATVYQDLNLVPNRDVASNIYLGLEPTRGMILLNRAKMFADAEAVLGTLGIKLPSVKVDVADLSGGQRQAVAIGRALARGGRFILMDEPTASLDPEASHMVREFIEKLSGEGRTIFLCTHNLDEADRLCTRIGVFKTSLMVVDTPANLRAKVFQRRVVFHLAKADKALADLVAGLPYVKQVELLDNKLIVAQDEPEAHNPEIIRLLVRAGAEIQFVGEIRRSLEDVYLQLMKEQ